MTLSHRPSPSPSPSAKRPFRCSTCTSTFSTQEKRKLHQIAKHASQVQPQAPPSRHRQAAVCRSGHRFAFFVLPCEGKLNCGCTVHCVLRVVFSASFIQQNCTCLSQLLVQVTGHSSAFIQHNHVHIPPHRGANTSLNTHAKSFLGPTLRYDLLTVAAQQPARSRLSGARDAQKRARGREAGYVTCVPTAH